MRAEASARLDGVQVLRGLAAMMVALGHYHGTASARGFELKAFDQIAIAAVGVDIFFVISGFIMELTTRESAGASASPKDFLVRRAIRLLPLYWLLTLFAYAVAKLPAAGVNAQHSPLALIHSLLLLPYETPDGAATYIISVAWSLTYEVYFYGLFALLLTVTPLRRIGTLLAAFTLSVRAGMVWHPQTALLRMVVDPMLLEFLAGCLLGWLFKRGSTLPWWGSVACVATAMAWLQHVLKVEVPEGARIIWWGLPAWLLVGGVVLSPSGPRWQFLRPLVSLGDVSYALYLTHFFTLALFVRLHRHWSEWMPVPPLLAFVVFVACSIGVSVLCYRWVEVPSRQYLSGLWRQRQVAAT